jgi:hypothetical protein
VEAPEETQRAFLQLCHGFFTTLGHAQERCTKQTVSTDNAQDHVQSMQAHS